ncbi:hypothetical protein CBW16_02310 [Flavobacteriaceae bacterium JJC]|nr:hypothetical protein CBW16_02310 [Flavobacteriaceae bacterium JJC]
MMETVKNGLLELFEPKNFCKDSFFCRFLTANGVTFRDFSVLMQYRLRYKINNKSIKTSIS